MANNNISGMQSKVSQHIILLLTPLLIPSNILLYTVTPNCVSSIYIGKVKHEYWINVTALLTVGWCTPAVCRQQRFVFSVGKIFEMFFF